MKTVLYITMRILGPYERMQSQEQEVLNEDHVYVHKACAVHENGSCTHQTTVLPKNF